MTMKKDEETKGKMEEKAPTPDDIEGCYGCIVLIVLLCIGIVTGMVLQSVMLK